MNTVLTLTPALSRLTGEGESSPVCLKKRREVFAGRRWSNARGSIAVPLSHRMGEGLGVRAV